MVAGVLGPEVRETKRFCLDLRLAVGSGAFHHPDEIRGNGSRLVWALQLALSPSGPTRAGEVKAGPSSAG